MIFLFWMFVVALFALLAVIAMAYFMGGDWMD